MSDQPGPIRPKVSDDLFIGWAGDIPKVDRRFLLGLGAGLVVAGGGVAAGLASVQNAPGPGTWDQGDVRDFVGALIVDPYPALRVLQQVDLDGTLRENSGLPAPSLIGCLGKCGVQPRLEAASQAGAGGLIAVRGTLIERGPHTMISAIDGPDWVRPAGEAPSALISEPPGLHGDDLGAATLTGEILDTKCWFGAMRPNAGKVHKACASLCIRGGLPPAFFARERMGRDRLFLLTGPRGGPLRDEILPLVADPVRASGQIVQRDFTEFRVDPAAITRI